MSDVQRTPLDAEIDEDPVAHDLKNHLAIIIGFCDLLLEDLPAEHPHRSDIEEIHRAAHAALAVVPQLTPRPDVR